MQKLTYNLVSEKKVSALNLDNFVWCSTFKGDMSDLLISYLSAIYEIV